MENWTDLSILPLYETTENFNENFENRVLKISWNFVDFNTENFKPHL